MDMTVVVEVQSAPVVVCLLARLKLQQFVQLELPVGLAIVLLLISEYPARAVPPFDYNQIILKGKSTH